METSRIKRERGKNYTENEKQLVLEIARKYVEIIDSKQTDATTNKRKNDAWDQIAHEFNPIAENGPRSGLQLKSLYQSMKKTVRRNILKGPKDFVYVIDPLENDLSGSETFDTNGEVLPTKIEPDDDSCFEVTEHVMGGSENSCSNSYFRTEVNKLGPNNFSTPMAEEKRNNDINFSVQKVPLNFNNASDIHSNISSTSKESSAVAKRERGKNFTELERVQFAKLVAKYTEILDLKENDGPTCKLKNCVWDRLLNEFHAIAQTGPRTKDQLKNLYSSLRKYNKIANSINQDAEIHFQVKNEISTTSDLYNQEKNNPNNFNREENLQQEDTGANSNQNDANHVESSEGNGVSNIESVNVLHIKTEQPIFTETESASPANSAEQEQNQILNSLVHQEQPTVQEQHTFRDQHTIREQPTVIQQQPQPEPPPETSAKRKRISEKSYRENVEKVKYEILLVRKEKEEIERDILLLDLRKKELEVKEKEFQLKNINII